MIKVATPQARQLFEPLEGGSRHNATREHAAAPPVQTTQAVGPLSLPSPRGPRGPPRGCRLGGSWLMRLSLRTRGRPSSLSPAPKQLAKGRGQPPTGASAASGPKPKSPRRRAARPGQHTLRSKRACHRAERPGQPLLPLPPMPSSQHPPSASGRSQISQNCENIDLAGVLLAGADGIIYMVLLVLQVLQIPSHCHAQQNQDLRRLLQGRCTASTAFAGCRQSPKRWRRRRRRRLWPQNQRAMGLAAL